MIRVHASCVAIGGRAVLLFGPSGAGKSDLALRLIDEGGALVSDDYTELTFGDGALLARAPATIRGLLEVRGVGIMKVASLEVAPVSLAVELGTPTERLPEPRSRAIGGFDVPVVSIDPRSASAAAKVRLALAHVASPTRSA